MLASRRALRVSLCCGVILAAVSVYAQNTVEREVEREDPMAREQWFREGRTLRGESAAALRYRAYQQKVALRTAQAAARAAADRGTVAGGTGPQWQNLGPGPLISDPSGSQSYGLVTGRMTSVVVDQNDVTGNTVYVAGAFGGVWRSTNAASADPAAVTFTPIIEDQATLAIGAIALKPNDSRVILIGTGEAHSSADSYYGLGILRSADGGATWTLISSADAGVKSFKGVSFSRIAFSADNPNLVVAATASSGNGVLVGADSSTNCSSATSPCTRGLYYSSDAGVTWNSVHVTDNGATPDGGSTHSAVYNPAQHKFYAVLRAHGVFSSSDGQNWTRVAAQPGSITPANCPASPTNLSSCPLYRGEITVRPGRDEMYIWYVNSSDTDGGIYKTTDGGQTWVTLGEGGLTSCGDSDGCGTQQGTYNLFLTAVPRGNGTELYAGAVNLFKCATAGSNPPCSAAGAWLNLTHVYGCNPTAAPSHVHPDQHAADFPLANPDIMYFGNDGGLYRTLASSSMVSGSCSATQPFDNLNAALGSLTQFVSLSVHPSDDSVMLGGTQDNGSPAVNRNSAGGNGVTWTEVNNGDGGYNEINPKNGDDWFTNKNNIRLYRCTQGTACAISSFQSIATSASLGGDTSVFYPPYTLDPAGTATVLYGTCRIWSGVPGANGYTWTALSNNFSAGAATTCASGNDLIRSVAAGGPATPAGNSQVMYAGTRGGRIWVTTQVDAGLASWVDRSSNINPSNFPVSDIYVDPRDATGSTAYITIMGFGTAHVFRTTDAGASWTNLTGDLPDAPATTVVLDPIDPSIVYLGSDVGVFMTRNGGANWTEYGAGLPNSSVTRLRLFSPACGGPNVLRASTYGRGVWQVALASVPTGTDYAFAVGNPSLAVYPSQSGSYSFSTRAFNGYTGNVAVSCSGSGSPTTCGTASGTVSACSTSAAVAASAATVRDYNFSLTAVGSDPGRTTHAQPVTLRVIDFTLGAATPATIEAPRGGTSNPVTFTLTPLGSFDRTISLGCRNQPAGISCNSAQSSLPLSGTATNTSLTITAAASVSTASYALTYSAIDSSDSTRGSRNQNVTVNVTDFQVSSGTSSQTVTHGSAAAYNLTVGPQGSTSFNLPVQLSCSGLPALAACSFTATQVTPGTGTSAVTMTITTAATGTVAPGAPLALLLRLPVLGLVFAGMLPGLGRRKRLATLLLLSVALAAVLLLAACGGGGGGTTTQAPPPTGGTPAGTYSITVTGTANGATRTTTVTLVVQ